ncbi:MAG: arylsulfatase [Bryobacterales bacterium]|nr:arylsulfatase [Bryobacterales bacterium]
MSSGISTRRAFLQTVPVVGLGAAPRKKPNIVWIMADDLGWGDVGCYGQKQIRTPHIDRMANEGLRFTDAYAGCTVCAPSRSVLMTGLHTGHTSVRSNPGGVPLLESDVTVAEVLKGAGYTNGIFGKWGLGDIGTVTAMKKGFDTHVGFLHQAHAHFQYPRFIYEDDRELPLEGNGDNSFKTYANDVFVEKGLAFIRENKDRPFFAYFALTIPHFAPQVPEDSMAEYRGKFPEGAPFRPPNGRLPEQRELRTAFAGMVSRMDRYAGRILALLKELGLERDTIVFFTSDNGGIRAGENYFNSTGPYRGQKGNLYEGGLRVPMVVRWPGQVPAGRTSAFAWSFQDFLPTAAELAGVKAPACDGISVLPALLGKKQKPHTQLYWEFPRYIAKTGTFAEEIPVQAMRRGDWKAVRPKAGGAIELYNLKSDPGETKDVAAGQASLVAEFDKAMRAAHQHPRPQREPAHRWWDVRS